MTAQLSSDARVDVLAVMDAACDEITNATARRCQTTRAAGEKFDAAPHHAKATALAEARAAVAELIAERDRLANIVRSHEAQIVRMTAEAAAVAELVAGAAKASVALNNYRATGKPDYAALTEASDALRAALAPFSEAGR